MFSDAELDKLIIYALVGIIAVLFVAVIALAVKKNIVYYVEEDKAVPMRKKDIVKATNHVKQPAAPAPEPVMPQKMEPLKNLEEDNDPEGTKVANLEVPLEVRNPSVKGVELSVTVNGQTTAHKVTIFPCLIGREVTSCNLVISEPAVSRRHAQLLQENGILYLEDVSEHNGTFLNGIKLPSLGRERIHEGDKISLGRAQVTIDKFLY